MTDSVTIRGLRTETHIGVTEEERSRPQIVLIDISAELPLDTAAEEDDLAQTLDYDTLVNEVAATASTGERRLLERLAAEICELIIQKFGVLGVTVEVAKEKPPVQQDVQCISVRMERRT